MRNGDDTPSLNDLSFLLLKFGDVPSKLNYTKSEQRTPYTHQRWSSYEKNSTENRLKNDSETPTIILFQF